MEEYVFNCFDIRASSWTVHFSNGPDSEFTWMLSLGIMSLVCDLCQKEPLKVQTSIRNL